MNCVLKQTMGWIPMALATLAMGCGSSGSDLGQVTGTVVMDGKPVPNLSIEFIPSDGRPSLARTNAEGQFTAYYLPKQPGATPGKHRLSSEFAQSGPEDVGFERPSRRGGAPGGKLVLRPSEIEVEAGENQPFELQLVEAK